MLNMSNPIEIMPASTVFHKHTFPHSRPARASPLIPPLIAIFRRFKSGTLHCTNCSVQGEHHGFKKIIKIKSLQAVPLEKQHSNYSSNSKFYKYINMDITEGFLKHYHGVCLSWAIPPPSPTFCFVLFFKAPTPPGHLVSN